MTALREYERLESGGLWRPSDQDQRRNVGVAFGDATLVISDNAGRPLTHWSLPAVERLNPGDRPAVFSPDPEGSETLEIEDDLMIGAIEKVRKSIARRRPKPGRLRNAGVGLTLVAMLGLGVFWLPGALTQQTLKMVPLSKRAEIGATILGHLQRLTGPTCRGPLGTQALARLKDRVLGAAAPGQIVVIPGDLGAPLVLPGRIVVLDRQMIEGPDDPAVVAGYVIAAVAELGNDDPLGAVLTRAGLRSNLQLLTTGDLPPDTLREHAEALLATTPEPPGNAALLAAFAAAGVPSTPYAYALDPTGETTLPLIEADPMAGQEANAALGDGDWIGLQGICR